MTTRELCKALGWPDTPAALRKIRGMIRQLPGVKLEKPASGPTAWTIPDDIDIEEARRIIESKANDGGGKPPFVPPAVETPPPPASPIRGPESEPVVQTPTKPSPPSSGMDWKVIAGLLVLLLLAAYSMGWLTPKPSTNSSGN